MPRKRRLEYEGAIYDVMNRGDQKEDIFVEDPDRQRFLETLGEARAKDRVADSCFCLMRNHFHLVVETPRANLPSRMQWFLGTYIRGRRSTPRRERDRPAGDDPQYSINHLRPEWPLDKP